MLNVQFSKAPVPQFVQYLSDGPHGMCLQRQEKVGRRDKKTYFYCSHQVLVPVRPVIGTMKFILEPYMQGLLLALASHDTTPLHTPTELLVVGATDEEYGRHLMSSI